MDSPSIPPANPDWLTRRDIGEPDFPKGKAGPENRAHVNIIDVDGELGENHCRDEHEQSNDCPNETIRSRRHYDSRYKSNRK